ncbi:MAG: ribosome maturation factor RimM [Chloroflexota bacterium]
MAPPTDERITVGLVRGLHGLRGAVRIEILSDDPTRFGVGSVVYAEGEAQPLTIAWAQLDKPGILVRFEGETSREAVEPLRDRYLEAEPAEPLPEGSWYWHEIEGIAVSSMTGEQLGVVAQVMRIAEAEVYVVRGGPRGEILVPAVRAIVIELLPAESRMTIDIMALGLPADAPPPQPPRKPRPPRQVRQKRLKRSRHHHNQRGEARSDGNATERNATEGKKTP